MKMMMMFSFYSAFFSGYTALEAVDPRDEPYQVEQYTWGERRRGMGPFASV